MGLAVLASRAHRSLPGMLDTRDEVALRAPRARVGGHILLVESRIGASGADSCRTTGRQPATAPDAAIVRQTAATRPVAAMARRDLGRRLCPCTAACWPWLPPA